MTGRVACRDGWYGSNAALDVDADDGTANKPTTTTTKIERFVTFKVLE